MGLVAVGIALASDKAHEAFQYLLTRWPLAPLVVTPLGFGIAVMIAVRFFPFTQGSGIPQVIAARTLTQARSFALRRVARRLRQDRPDTARTFGGCVYGARGSDGAGRRFGDVWYRQAQPATSVRLARRWRGCRSCGSLQHAARRGGVRHRGNEPELRNAHQRSDHSGRHPGGTDCTGPTGRLQLLWLHGVGLPFGTAWMAVPLCGVVGGFAGALFSRALVMVPDYLPAPAAAWIKAHPVAFAAVCGFGVALCGVASGAPCSARDTSRPGVAARDRHRPCWFRRP